MLNPFYIRKTVICHHIFLIELQFFLDCTVFSWSFECY